ncbi:MAG: DUF4268 domain-containing protein [Methylocystis sp.]
MNLPKLSSLETIRLRSIWPTESRSFTPWLAENLNLLTDALLIEPITDAKQVQTESPVGDFRLDILVGQDGEDGGRLVLIENQFGTTDHRHFGQILTYVAGQSGPITAIWIAEDFREEHRAAIDWLNNHTDENANFFGVEIQAVRIENSPPAPWFKVVAKPNNWVRSVNRRSGGEPGDLGRLYLEYWEKFLAYSHKHGLKGSAPARPIGRYSFPSGRSGFRFRGFIDATAKQLRAEVWIRPRGAVAAAFSALENGRADIERKLDYELQWKNLETRALIWTALDYQSLEDRGDWLRQHTWLLAKLKELIQTFRDPIRRLDLGTSDEDNSDSDD